MCAVAIATVVKPYLSKAVVFLGEQLILFMFSESKTVISAHLKIFGYANFITLISYILC